MKVTAFLIKYGEIAIKGKNRFMFEDALMRETLMSEKNPAVCLWKAGETLITMKR